MPGVALVAVSELMFRAKIKDAAAGVGRAIVVASRPGAVLEKARANTTDLVVIDLDDERMNGCDVVRELKSDPELSGIRVIGFFSHVRVDVLDEARAAGCDLVLPRSSFVARLPQLLDPQADAAANGAE